MPNTFTKFHHDNITRKDGYFIRDEYNRCCMQRKIFSFVTIASLLIGLAIFFWGHGVIRNYGGDVVVVIFLYALASTLTVQSPQTKLLAIGGFVFIIECAQIFITYPGNVLQEITLGAYFDPLDLFAYAFGLFVAYAIERIQQKHDA